MRTLAWSLVLPALMSFTTPASAALISFSFSGSGFSGSGTFTTDDTNTISNPFPCSGCADGPGSLVTAVTGSVNGQTITGLGDVDSFFSNTNRFYLSTTNDAVDFGGIALITTADEYNIFNGAYDGEDGLFILSNADSESLYLHPIVGTAQLITSAVPEPATWAMMLVGLGIVGLAVRGKRQRQQVRFAF